MWFIYVCIERCAIDHPHHVLYHILALANAYADIAKSEVYKNPEPRVVGAHQIISKLRNNEKTMLPLRQMELMCTGNERKIILYIGLWFVGMSPMHVKRGDMAEIC